MAIKLTSKPNTDPVSGTWPFGSVRDDDGSGNGTEVDRNTYSDNFQFFESLMNYASVVANDLPDNATNGFQFLEALQKAISKRISTRIVAGNNLDNDKIVGIFSVSSTGISNGPSGFTGDGQLVITDDGTFLWQRLLQFTGGIEWNRRFDGANWSGWVLNRMGQKVVEIGDWNMDTTVTKDVDIEVAHTKVRSISVLIKSDSNGYLVPIDIPDPTTQLPAGSVGNIFGTEITLRRFDSARFDDAAFSDTGYNRGYVYVTYVP